MFNHIAVFIAKWDSQDPAVVSVKNFFKTLVAGRILSLREQSSQNDNFRIDIQSG